MQKVKKVFLSKWFYVPIILLSLILNILFFIESTIPEKTLSKRLSISNITPNDNEQTIYLAHGVVAFGDKTNQPKDAMQVQTFYMDMVTSKVYMEEVFILGNILNVPARIEMNVVSFDKESMLITLSGNGFKKVVIDMVKRQLINSEDTTGDITYLKSSYDI